MARHINKCLCAVSIFLSFFITGLSMNAVADEVWIDVRTSEEHAAGHVAGALLMPHDQIAALISEQVPDKNAEIQLYCRSGRRADVARDILLQMGYTSVTNHGSLENALAITEQQKSDN